MKPIRAAGWIAAGLACGSVWAQAQGQVNPPASTASQPPGVSSPAVRATQNARSAEDLRPEKRPVPQLTVPLKRRDAGVAPAASSAPAPGRPAVDDELARCRASESARERAACNALTGGGKAQPAAARGG